VATAVLIDGAYFIKRFRSIEPQNAHNAVRAAEFAFSCALAHLTQRNGQNKEASLRADLYRIFFYDCEPVEKKMHNPITNKSVDFSKSEEAIFRRALHEELRKKRKVALRLGQLSTDANWTLKPGVIQQILKKEITFDELSENSVVINVRQKGVDMRIGIDITSIALKKQATQIVLVAGDADFVPAAKLARREGVDFVLDPMWNNRVPTSLNEHVDGIRSTCPRPPSRSLAPAADAAPTAENGNIAIAVNVEVMVAGDPEGDIGQPT